MGWETLLYKTELAWRQLGQDFSAPVAVGIAGAAIIFVVMTGDIRERNRQSLVMRTQSHCVDPRNSLDPEV